MPVVKPSYEYWCVQFGTVESDWSARCELIYSAARPSLSFRASGCLRDGHSRPDYRGGRVECVFFWALQRQPFSLLRRYFLHCTSVGATSHQMRMRKARFLCSSNFIGPSRITCSLSTFSTLPENARHGRPTSGGHFVMTTICTNGRAGRSP